jgi:hypothetical protein
MFYLIHSEFQNINQQLLIMQNNLTQKNFLLLLIKMLKSNFKSKNYNCSLCFSPSPILVIGAPGKTQQVDPRDGWVCPSCTLLNVPTRPGEENIKISKVIFNQLHQIKKQN